MGLLRDLVELVGWDGLTVSEQTIAAYGGAAGLAAVLLARALFGGGRRR
jgi:hypothetical protein